MTSPEPEKFCGEALYTFQENFELVYGYIVLPISFLGSAGNVLNIWVFTRKNMLTPTNLLFIGLTIADMVVLLVNIPYTWFQYLRAETTPYKDLYTYGWTSYYLWSINLQRVFHGISTWHTIMLAIWRYIAVVYPFKERIWCSMKNTCVAIFCGYVVYPLIHIPLFFTFAVKELVEVLDENGFENDDCFVDDGVGCRNTTVYKIRFSDMATTGFLKGVNFFIYSILFRLTPSVLLAVFSLRLIYTLIESKNRRQKLMSQATRESNQTAEKEKQMDRTTKTLLVVLILFLITEVPAGVFGFLSMVYGIPFYVDCYRELVEIFDLLTLVYSSITFAIYYTMSAQFRATFKTCVYSFKFKSDTKDKTIDEEPTTEVSSL